MVKVVGGVVSAILAVSWLLYGIGCEPRTRDTWLLAKIPALWFFGMEIPRVFVLIFPVAWFCAGIKSMVTGFDDMASLSRFTSKLRAGKSAATIFAEEVRATIWNSSIYQIAANDILSRVSYARAIENLTKKGESLDSAVLSYKLVVDQLLSKCKLIREALSKARLSDDSLPDISFPTVRVAASRGLFARLKKDDLIYAYADKLIETTEALAREAAQTRSDAKVVVRLLRYVQTTNHHPLTGMANECCWQALQVEISGGLINCDVESQGARKVVPDKSTQELGTRALMDVPQFVRFKCRVCRKSLKTPMASLGKKLKCPNCGAEVTVAAKRDDKQRDA